MKSFTVCLSMLVLLLCAGPVQSDCGKSHKKSNPHGMGKISATSFQDMDTDKSGGVSFKEFKAMFSKTSQEGFNMLDKDANTQLSETEWKAFKDAHKGMGNYKQSPETT